MGYAHHRAQVSLIEGITESRRKEYVPNESDVMRGGLPVSPRLAEFIDAVLAKLPGATVGFNDNCSRGWNNSGTGRVAYMEAYVYIPGQVYALGRIGYKPYMKAGSGEQHFGVLARTITNERFSASNESYHIRFSSDMKVAVKHALTYMRPYATEEIIKHTIQDLYSSVVNAQASRTTAVVDARNAATNSVTLQRELTRLIDSGYEFSTPGYKEIVQKWLDAEQARSEETTKPVHAYYVVISGSGGSQHADITEVFDIASGHKVGSTLRLPMDSLPDYLSGKIAVLMMTEMGSVIPDVGQRISNNMFYVIREVA